MNAKEALKEVLESAKPMTTTSHSRRILVEQCARSGIVIDTDLNIINEITEAHIKRLSENLSNAVIRMVIRRVLRKYQ